MGVGARAQLDQGWTSLRKETIELILQEVLEYLVYMTGMVREGTGGGY